MTTTNAIEVSGLTFGYGRRTVLADLAFEVPVGSTTVLLGENGAGKTTLLRLLAGLLAPARGRVRVLEGDPARDRRRLSERIGLVPDAPDAWAWMRAPQLLAFLAAHHPRWNHDHAEDLLARLHVPRELPLGAMSRGQATKAMLVAALAHEPEVLLLDEPFAGLDPLVHEEVLRALVEAMGGGPRTLLVSTHDLDVASRVGDRVAVLAGGRIARHATMEEAASPEGGSRRDSLKSLLAGTAEEAHR